MLSNSKILVFILTFLILLDCIRILIPLISILKRSRNFSSAWLIIIASITISGVNNYLITFIAFYNIDLFMRLRIGLLILTKTINEVLLIYVIPKVVKIENNINCSKSFIYDSELSDRSDIMNTKGKLLKDLDNE